MNTLSIINGLVFDGVSDELIEAPVHVVNGRIAAVGGAAQKADRVIDAAGGTVIPGLIDAHCHAYGIEMDNLVLESRPLSYIALAAARRLAAALQRGFTTIRDPAGGDAGMTRAINEGLIAAPRYLWAGAALSQTGGYGDVRAPDSLLCGCSAHTVEVVDGVDPIRRAIRDRFRRGAHAIKIMASGGVTSEPAVFRRPQYSPEEIKAAAEEAARHGSYVLAHAYSSEAIRHAVENGVRTIEHGNLLDHATAQLMNAAGSFLVPTLAIYDALIRRGGELGMSDAARQRVGEVLQSGFKAIEIARRAGVRIGFGSDLLGALEDEQLHGLRLQIEVDGVFATLQSATSVNADIIGRADLGRVQEGCIADLLILDGNPFKDPAVLWDNSPRVVIQGGKVH